MRGAPGRGGTLLGELRHDTNRIHAENLHRKIAPPCPCKLYLGYIFQFAKVCALRRCVIAALVISSEVAALYYVTRPSLFLPSYAAVTVKKSTFFFSNVVGGICLAVWWVVMFERPIPILQHS